MQYSYSSGAVISNEFVLYDGWISNPTMKNLCIKSVKYIIDHYYDK